MPATTASVVSSAVKEWEHWGKSTWDVAMKTRKIAHTDDEVDFAKYVLADYCSVGGGSPSLMDISDDRYYWSAVGMSAIMKQAGFTRKEFPFAQAHSVYLRRFIAARKSADVGAAFWGFRLNESGGEPNVGDLVAYARGKGMTAAKAEKLFDTTSTYDSHTDVVVAARAGEIDVIGCNVLDSVTKKTLKLNAAGHIDDNVHFWFATLKRR